MAATCALRAELIVAKSADEYTSQAIDCSNFGSLTLSVQASGTISGGVITIEEADYREGDAPYAGTWAPIMTLTGATDFLSDAQYMNHFPYPDLAWKWIRARISTAIAGGGTVTVVLLGRPSI